MVLRTMLYFGGHFTFPPCICEMHSYRYVYFWLIHFYCLELFCCIAALQNIHFIIDGFGGCLEFGATMNDAAINTLIRIIFKRLNDVYGKVTYQSQVAKTIWMEGGHCTSMYWLNNHLAYLNTCADQHVQEVFWWL